MAACLDDDVDQGGKESEGVCQALACTLKDVELLAPVLRGFKIAEELAGLTKAGL